MMGVAFIYTGGTPSAQKTRNTQETVKGSVTELAEIYEGELLRMLKCDGV